MKLLVTLSCLFLIGCTSVQYSNKDGSSFMYQRPPFAAKSIGKLSVEKGDGTKFDLEGYQSDPNTKIIEMLLKRFPVAP